MNTNFQTDLARYNKTPNDFVKFFKEKAGPLIALVALTLIISISSEYFLTYNNIINVLRQISTTAMVTYAATFCLISGNIDLSVGSIVAFSGVVLTVLLLNTGMAFGVALVLAILCGTLVGVANGTIVAMTGLPPFIVTLAMQSIVRGLAYFACDGTSVRVDNAYLKSLGNGLWFGIPISIVIVIIITVICIFVLGRTIFGRNMYACGGNREAAKYSGINVKKIDVLVYTIAGTLSGIGGVLLAGRVYSGQPTAGAGMEGDAISAAVLGGVAFSGGSGSISAAIIGVFIIGIMNNALNLWELSSFWQLIVKGLILIIAVYVDTAKKRRENKV